MSKHEVFRGGSTGGGVAFAAAAVSSSSAGAGSGGGRGRKRILVVDDEKDLVDLITYNLQRNGYDVDAWVGHSNGREDAPTS